VTSASAIKYVGAEQGASALGQPGFGQVGPFGCMADFWGPDYTSAGSASVIVIDTSGYPAHPMSVGTFSSNRAEVVTGRATSGPIAPGRVDVITGYATSGSIGFGGVNIIAGHGAVRPIVGYITDDTLVNGVRVARIDGLTGAANFSGFCGSAREFEWGQSQTITASTSSCGLSVSAFGELDGAPRTLMRCLRVLDSRSLILSERQANALRRQLRALLADENELAEAGISVSIATLHELIDFLATADNKQHPNLSITRDGYFSASWSPRRRAKLTMVFKGASRVDWVAVDLDHTPVISAKGDFAHIPPEIESWMSAA